ncbi:MAG: transcriptional repressor [Acidobacteriota bacterium]|nr:transcriptional repressor [Acidobacteriota bacterium]MDH3528327.1 transcriptional repressor [Acidobacteriota bacterium]
MDRLSLRAVEEMASGEGFKMTPQRRVIVNYLEKATNHPTADDVFYAVNKKFPMTSRATVYNTLNWLKTVGMLRERFEGEKMRYDPNCERHHHFICHACGLVEDINSELIEELDAFKLPGKHKVESYEVTVRGVCRNCRK